MLLTLQGFGTVREYTPETVVFDEDGGVLSTVLGEHRKFRFVLDRRAKTPVAVGRPDETTVNVGRDAIFDLRH